MKRACPYCERKKSVKRGLSKGKQRYRCNACRRTFSDGAHSQGKKDFALLLYLNNNGIRQISRILKISPSLVLKWLKKAHKHLLELLARRGRIKREVDVIELDEIYTYVKKNFADSRYGLLIADGKSVLLRLSSETGE